MSQIYYCLQYQTVVLQYIELFESWLTYNLHCIWVCLKLVGQSFTKKVTQGMNETNASIVINVTIVTFFIQ